MADILHFYDDVRMKIESKLVKYIQRGLVVKTEFCFRKLKTALEIKRTLVVSRFIYRKKQQPYPQNFLTIM